MIRIYADSTNDLSCELIEKYNITIVPLYIRMGDRTVRDGPEFDPEAMYAWASAHKTTPQTASFSPGDAQEALAPAVEAGDEVLFFGISTDLSSSCASFKVAAANLDYSDHVFVVDSRNLCNGIALLILKAAEMAREGKMTAAEIWLEIEKLIPLVRSTFVVDTLTYLYRGGRCSAVSAIAASALGIKPKIIVSGGKMSVGTKYRGKAEIVARKYVKDMRHELLRADKERVFICNSGVSQSVLDVLTQEIQELKYFNEIIYTRAGGIISSHCGPGTFAVIFLAQPEN